MSLLSGIDYYLIWFGLATVLLLLEAIFGSFTWMAASLGALIVGSLSYYYSHVGFEIQILFFVVLGSFLVWSAKHYVHQRTAETEQKKAEALQNRSYVGRIFSLIDPIKDGRSSINIDGVVWYIQGHDSPAGKPVRIVDMSESTLVVEAV